MTGGQDRALTELAKRYKHPTGKNHKIIANTGKSGLTPVNIPLRHRRLLSKPRNKFISHLESYQRRRCEDFTTQQLVDLEAFAPHYQSWTLEGRENGGVSLDDLTNNIPIHPLFSRPKWDRVRVEHIGKVPLGRGRPGYFEAQNNLVWEALEPCLRLATAIISNCHTLTWWDALFNGVYNFIEEDIPEEWQGSQLLRFRPRSSVCQDEARLQSDIVAISRNIGYCLISGWTEVYTGLPSNLPDGGFDYARTYKDLTGEIQVFISFELLEPLMRDDLTPAERKLDIFRFASVLLHETCHAIWFELQPRFGGDKDTEPYLEGQPLPELGFSMEEAVFGGTSSSITDQHLPPLELGIGLPSAGIFSTSFFNKGKIGYWGSTSPAVPPFPKNWEYKESFPVPVGYFEDLFRPEFWDYARRYGTGATRMGPKTLGSRVPADPNEDQLRERSPYHDLPPEREMMILGSMTLEEERAALLENLRRSRAHRIFSTIKHGEEDIVEDNKTDEGPLHMDGNHPHLASSETTLGEDFDTLSAVQTEYWEDTLPPCPRYEEIRRYFLENRSQGRLCLDTMRFAVPEYTMIHYIEVFGGIAITPEEWRAFLRHCTERTELFAYNPVGRGMVQWIAAAPENADDVARPPGLVTIPADEDLRRLREACLGSDWWMCRFPDFDFAYLLKLLRALCKGDGSWLDENLLRVLVDWHDVYGDLWCWGPNWVVRRKEAGWKVVESNPTGGPGDDP